MIRKFSEYVYECVGCLAYDYDPHGGSACSYHSKWCKCRESFDKKQMYFNF